MLARGRDAGDQFARESAGGAAREQLAAWSAMAQRRGMSLVLEAPAQASAADPDDAPAAAAQADPPRFPAPLLRALLSNLIRNSLQYAGPGARVTISAGPHYLQVADDGPGIPPDIADAIFEPFVSGRENGTGLGLALVSKIISDHDGWISVDSVPGRTVFRISLPVAPKEK